MIIICTLLAVLLGVCMVAVLYKNQDIVISVIQGIVLFTMGYVIASEILLTINKFSIIAALCIVIIVELICLILLIAVKHKRPSATYDYKKSILVVVVFVAMIPFLIKKNGYLGVSQDAGVYQTRAIAMLQGHNDNYFSFEEYDELQAQNEKNTYMGDLDQTLTGYYFASPAADDTTVTVNETTGILHGIHAYSAVLALVGSILGMSGMMYTGGICIMLLLFVMYQIMSNLEIKTAIKLLGLVIIAFSPPIMWLMKTTLAETLLVLFVAEYVYFMTDRRHRELAWISVIPVITYAFFHISIYVMMPMLVLIYYVMYLLSKKKSYLLMNIVILISYYAGFLGMLHVSDGYTYGNYKNLYIIKCINDGNLVQVVSATVVVAVLVNAVTFMVHILLRKKAEKAGPLEAEQSGMDQNQRARKSGKTEISPKLSKVIQVIIRIMIVAGIAMVILVVRKFVDISYSSAYAFVASTGVVILPLTLLILMARPCYVSRSREMIALTMLVFYELMGYSIIFISYIAYYYYYARYVIIHMPVVVILCMYVLNKVYASKKIRKITFRGAVIAAAIVCVFAMYLPYNIVIGKQTDQTAVEWDVLDEVAEKFHEGDAVVMSQEWSLTAKIPIKLMTGADVYPVVENAVNEQLANLKSSHTNVYLMTNEKEEYVNRVYRANLMNIAVWSNEVSYGTVEYQGITPRGKYLPFALSVVKNSRPLYLYQL